MRDDGPAEGAGGISGAVLCKCPQTGFTEDVVARMAHVRAEVHVQTHGADEAISVPRARGLLILTAAAAAAAAGWVSCRALVVGDKKAKQHVFVNVNKIV